MYSKRCQKVRFISKFVLKQVQVLNMENLLTEAEGGACSFLPVFFSNLGLVLFFTGTTLQCKHCELS